MKKTPRDIILHMCTKNYDQMIRHLWYDERRMDGRMEKVTYRGGLPT